MIEVTHSARLTPEQRELLFKVDNIIYWPRGNVAIICNGKTANTALKTAVLHAMGGVNPFYNVHADPRLLYMNREQVFKHRMTVPVLGVIRDPWDRIVSFWRDKIAPRTAETFTADYLPFAKPGMGFLEFVQLFLISLYEGQFPDPKALHDLRPAADLFYHGDQWLPLKVMSYDRLRTPEGWQEFRSFTAAMYELPAVLPHVNGPRVPMPVIPADAESELRERVRDVYRMDYVILENIS